MLVLVSSALWFFILPLFFFKTPYPKINYLSLFWTQDRKFCQCFFLQRILFCFSVGLLYIWLVSSHVPSSPICNLTTTPWHFCVSIVLCQTLLPKSTLICIALPTSLPSSNPSKTVFLCIWNTNCSYTFSKSLHLHINTIHEISHSLLHTALCCLICPNT